jgi:hypothetical protein
MNDNANSNFQEFLINNCLTNKITQPTRITKKTQTLIDVVIENGNFIKETQVIGCPFSDHCFTTAQLNIIK